LSCEGPAYRGAKLVKQTKTTIYAKESPDMIITQPTMEKSSIKLRNQVNFL